MTAEIVVLNRSAVALAADSAVTVGRERVWKFSNKLFSMSPVNDIGIMIYGSGDFCGVPWEAVIKTFRQQVTTEFATVSALKDAFIEYLSNFPIPHGDVEPLNVYILFLRFVERCLRGTKNTSGMERRSIIRENIKQAHADSDDVAPLQATVALNDFDHAFGQLIRGFARDGLDGKITKGLQHDIVTTCFDAFNKECPSGYETGVVFVGFGANQTFPEIVHIIFDGRSQFGLRYWVDQIYDLNDDASPSSCVMPFAQRDIAFLFVEGIDLGYLDFIEKTISSMLVSKSDELINRYVPEEERDVERKLQTRENEAGLKEFFEQFRKFRHKQTVEKMMRVVYSLPKEEMADMAEALVEITSLRRKVDSTLESVGGPVDVAVISKGDGFVWIKRKHYFDLSLNSDFPARKRLRHAWQQGEA